MRVQAVVDLRFQLRGVFFVGLDEVVVVSLELVQLLSQHLDLGVHLGLRFVAFVLQRLVLVDQLVASLLPLVVHRLEPFLVLEMLLQQADADSLVDINQVISYFYHVLIGVIL